MNDNELNIILYEEMPFNNKGHISNHLNYLFRTDYNQKWTNELTKTNCYINFLVSDSIKSLDVSSKERADIKKSINDYINKVVSSENEIKEKLKMMLVEIENEPSEDVKEGMFETISNFVEIMQNTNGIEPLVIMTHFDQEEMNYHFHIVFINNSDKKLCEYMLEE